MKYKDKITYLRSAKVVAMVFLLLFTSLNCQEDFKEEVEGDLVVIDDRALERFEKFVSNPENAIDSDLKSYFNGEALSIDPSEESQLIEQIGNNELRPLLNESLVFLYSSGFTEQELTSEFGSLQDPGLIITAFVLLIGQSSSLNNDTLDQRTSSFMHCLGSATGLYGIWELVTGGAAASRVAIIRAVGKFARRSLGWIGAALFVGEFIQCYWGDNSVFDRT